MDIDGKVAIVTGAGAGIGAAIARRLVEHGVTVSVSDLDAGAAAATAAALNVIRADSALGVGSDAADESALRALIAQTEEAFGPVGLYFANAGVGLGAGLEAADSAWETALSVNVMAHVRAARLLVPGWVERGEGYFFSTASAAGLLTQLGSPTYAVSKHAAVGFAEWLRVTYGDKGVRVSCLCPMGVNTALLNAGDNAEEESARIAAKAVKRAGKVLEPLDVADVVIEAIDDERFLVLPHPEVLEMYRHKGQDYDRWIAGMQRYRASLG
jgi:NAD(P)-dependent dehydrogenase (short-subunit alcohol dehydrogenase family)